MAALSGILMLHLMLSTGDLCTVPSSFFNQTSRTEAGVKYTFALDKSAYIFGSDEIHFYYIVENVGPDTLYFGWGADPQRAFVIYPDTCYALDQEGCMEAAILFDPLVTYLSSPGFTLLPGECKAFQRSWDQQPECAGVPYIGCAPAPGSYRVFSGLWKLLPVALYWPGQWVGPSDLSLEIVIEDTPTGILPSNYKTWGRIKSLFR